MEVSRSNELSFYSERNSVNVFDDARRLFEPPPVVLDAEQKVEALGFAKQLYEGQVGEIKRNCKETLTDIEALSPESAIQNFYLGYFHTPQGREDLALMGVDSQDLEQLPSRAVVIAGNVDKETRKLIATRSREWYKEHVADAIKSDKALDKVQIDEQPVRINFDPAKLINKIALLKEHRQFYRAVATDLKDTHGPTQPAKNVELDIARSKANQMLAELYDDAVALTKQLRADTANPVAGVQLERLNSLLPLVSRALSRERTEQRQTIADFEQSLARRTDHLINGVAWTQDGINPVSAELLDFAANLDEEHEPEVQFGPEVAEKLKQTKWNAEQFKDFCEEVLKSWDLLSSQQTGWSDASERDGAAADNLWQVIIDPQFKSLGVDKQKKVLSVPGKFNRAILNSLPVAAHELAHLVQAENDDRLAKTIPQAAVGGRRNITLREAGALDQEAKVYAAFGQPRPTRLGYLGAIKKKLAGGNIAEIARGFYEAYDNEQKLSEEQKQENRALAADRSLRLFRNGGYDSQPLDYVEGRLTQNALQAVSPEVAEGMLLAGTAFSLKDQILLHEAGIYEPPTHSDKIPSDVVIKLFQEKYLDNL